MKQHDSQPDRRVKSVLAKQCSAVWRLLYDGGWELVHVSSGTDLGQTSQIAELFASICIGQLTPGTTVTARFGDDMIIAKVDEYGVLVSMKERGGNPIMIKTAMARLETRSRRTEQTQHTARTGAAGPDEVVGEVGGEVSGAPTRSSRSTRSARTSQAPAQPHEVEAPGDLDEARPENFSRPPTRTVSLTAEDSASAESARSQRIPSLRDIELISFEDDSSSDLDAEAASVATPSRGDEFAREDSLAFEIVFTAEDDSEASVAPMPSADFRPGCTWDEVGEFFETVMTASSDYLGRAVCANYWSQAMTSYSALEGCITFGALGRISIQKGSKDVTPKEAEALTRVIEDWKERASRAIGDVEASLPQLELQPWRTAHIREKL